MLSRRLAFLLAPFLIAAGAPVAAADAPAKPGIRGLVSMDATAIEPWQDYKGFPLVPDATLKRWALMIEANKGR